MVLLRLNGPSSSWRRPFTKLHCSTCCPLYYRHHHMIDGHSCYCFCARTCLSCSDSPWLSLYSRCSCIFVLDDPLAPTLPTTRLDRPDSTFRHAMMTLSTTRFFLSNTSMNMISDLFYACMSVKPHRGSDK